MSRDGYAWWRRRLAGLSQYFSAYRIDHILGFFRIWEMPEGTTTGLLGRFRPSVPLWRDELEAQGVWDFDRLCEPFITEELVEEVFGEELAPLVMGVTEDVGHGRLRLVSGLHTEELICEVLGAGCEGGALRAERKGGCGYSASAAAGRLGGSLDRGGLRDAEGARPAAQGAEADAGGGVAAEAALWAFRAAVPALGGATRAALRRGLLQLVQNVCLLRDPDEERRFYPRILVERTQSFGALDERTQQALSNLYRSYFFERQDDLWAANARRTIPALMGATRMLVCGEDLGMLPTCCPPTLRSLGLLGLRIQRMPVGEGEFGEPADYPYLSVCSPSCHDTTPTRAWWEEDHARAGRLWRDCLGREGEPPRRATPEVVRAVVEQHMRSPSMWAVFPLQDLYALRREARRRRAGERGDHQRPDQPEALLAAALHVALEELLADEGGSRSSGGSCGTGGGSTASARNGASPSRCFRESAVYMYMGAARRGAARCSSACPMVQARARARLSAMSKALEAGLSNSSSSSNECSMCEPRVGTSLTSSLTPSLRESDATPCRSSRSLTVCCDVSVPSS